MGHYVCGLNELLGYVDTNVMWVVEGDVGFLGNKTAYVGKTILRGSCSMLI